MIAAQQEASRWRGYGHFTWEGTLSGTLGQLPSDGEVRITFPDGTAGTAHVSEVTNETATLRTVWALGLGPEPPWQRDDHRGVSRGSVGPPDSDAT